MHLYHKGSPNGGASGIRTHDPFHAMEVRYQLRYSPSKLSVTTERNYTRTPGKAQAHSLSACWASASVLPLSPTPLSQACVSVFTKPPERVQEEEDPFLFLRA